VFTDDGLIATACDDGTVRVWDPSKRRPDEELPGHPGTVSTTRFSPDGTVVLSAGHTSDDDPDSVKLWSVDDGSLLRGIDANSGDWVSDALFINDHNDFATSWLNDVAFWGNDGRFIGRWDAPSGNALLASIDDQWVLGGSHRGLARLDPTRAEPITTVSTEERVNRAALTPDGHLLFGASEDGVVQTWNAVDLSRRTRVAAHDADRVQGMFAVPAIRALAVSPDSRHGLTADGADGTVHVWELATGKEVRLLAHPATVTNCSYSPDGTTIVSTTNDGTIWVWDAHEPVPARQLVSGSTAPAYDCAVSPDGRLLIASHWDRSMSLRELATGAVVTSILMAGFATSFGLHPWRPFLTCGDQVGNVSLIEMVGVNYGAIVVTAHERAGQASLFVRCPRCRLKHHVDRAQLGGQYLCPTVDCGLPLRLNTFFSGSAPSTTPDSEARKLTPPPTTLTGEELAGIRCVLLESPWYGLDNEMWRFHPDGKVTFSDEPSQGTWTLNGRDAVVVRGEYDIHFSARVDSDMLSCLMWWRRFPENTLIPLTLRRAPS
jgi:WD40 repeat protein